MIEMLASFFTPAFMMLGMVVIIWAIHWFIDRI